ncbi:MAG: PD-(D/E)XK nuclease family protein [Chloroflexota bacterium]|nr:PD-(D/E)XK nuclease family protein [Chloroflexota bacterium]
MPQLIRPGHLFSQHSLNTYKRCARRFLLKYVEEQPWPTPEEEDPRAYERQLARGRTFHEWLERYHLGLDMEAVVAACQDPQLQDWWAAAKDFDRDVLPQDMRETELPIVVPLGKYRLYARYDYVALDIGGDAAVVDWKTLEFRPSEEVLRRRIQTRVYLYTLVAAGEVLTGGPPIDPDRAEMVYWFANYPEQTARIPYSRADFARDGAELRDLVNEIARQPPEAFGRTQDRRLCAHCNYRTLCDREGVVSETGGGDWLDEDIDFNLELLEVPELEY